MRFGTKTPLIKQVQWSSFEKRRVDDVMSTSFCLQGVPRVACFVVCPHVVFKFGFACRVVREWVRRRLRQSVRYVFTVLFAPSHVSCCVAVGVRGCSTWLHYALRECFPCE